MKTLLYIGFAILAFGCHLVTSQLSGASTLGVDANMGNNVTEESFTASPPLSLSENDTSEFTETDNTSAAPADTSGEHIDSGLTTTPLPVPEHSSSTLPSAELEAEGEPHVDTAPETTALPDSPPPETTPEEVVTTTERSVVIAETSPPVVIVTSEDESNTTLPMPQEVPATVPPPEDPTTEHQGESLPSTTSAPKINETSSTEEPPITIPLTVTTIPPSQEDTPSDNANETSSVPEAVTLPAVTTSSQFPSNMSDASSSNTSEVNATTEAPESSVPSLPVTTDDGRNLPSSGNNNCFGTAEVNTVLIVAIVVGVNVLSIIVTAFCVHRLVSRRLSWDPPPMHYSKQRTAAGHPLAAPRTGLHLATDTECRSGENPATQIPIVITNEDGWCVPYSEQDKKKKNNADNNTTEDTGV